MKKRSLVSVLAFLLLFSIIQPVLAEGEAEVERLRVGITTDESTLNPYTYVTGYPGLDMINLLYDNLFQLDSENLPVPWLVEDYDVSEDGLVYNFKLHEGVTWHDGETLTADDVKFTVEYFREYPKSRFTNPLSSIENIEVHSDTEFTFELTQAEANFMVQPLADLPILPEHIWKDIDNPDDENNSIGSGPYVLQDYRSSQYYTMVANEDYYRGSPMIKEIIFPIIEDTTALFTALGAGEIDVISASISPELVEQFENNPAITVERGPGYSTALFQINAEKYPMTEKPFRQAISHAVNTEDLVDTILLGYAETGSPGFIHPSSPFFNEDLAHNFDPDKAEQLLEEAGFTDVTGDGYREDQDGNEIKLTTLVYSDNPIRIRTAEMIVEALNNIGLNVDVRAMDMTTVDSLMWPDFDVSKGREYDLGVWSWSNTMQLFPDRMIDLFYSDPSLGSVNIGGYASDEFDQLANTLRETVDEDERLRIIQEMQAFVAEDTPLVPLYYQEIVNAYNAEVYDGYKFQLGKGIINKLSFVSMDDGATPAEEASDGNDADMDADAGADSSTDEGTAAAADLTRSENTGSGGNAGSMIILLLVIAGIAAGAIFIKKKSGRADQA
ncbi:ABC transporter substrate-binding protein [Evansella halocellulosilytica]|uniref:ABC transporter substrate-binding protein n=1 Tax=Evansella halocellulosilytica TaxID=2011013 RepID=UPI000BB94DDA|nr:ABC transporter substrate-binding protein [Evansella halocellulosilytica]